MGTDTSTQSAPAPGRRKTGFGTDGRRPGIERIDGVWHLRTYAAVRQVLRDAERARQGATTDNVLMRRLRPSVIFQDGEAHREQRTAIARFFAPKTVDRDYQGVIDELTTRLLGRLQASGRADVSDLSMELSVEVAARVVGLTDSRRPGMDRRIDALLSGSGEVFPDGSPGLLDRLRGLRSVAQGLWRTGSFFMIDVRPAIAARRAQPREDVISHLLGKGYNPLEILVECLTYATAGMVTTREFIVVAAWHLLENPELRERYVAADQGDRRRLLHEILRLEPVASTLWRRAEHEVVITDGEREHRIPAGSRMVLDIRTANADPAAVGEEPLVVRPGRGLSSGVKPEGVAFGDGTHKCPGAFLAIHESDVFLHALLALPVRMESEPVLTFNDMIKSYEIRGLVVRCD
ncbi:MAG: cytochrome P450 [Mobilicoccus sp.]|nr:cytochrome P450 [Mobilicoccus sp.]